MNEKEFGFHLNYPGRDGCDWPKSVHKAVSARFIPHGAPSGYRRTGVEQIETCACGATRHVWITTFKVEAGAWS